MYFIKTVIIFVLSLVMLYPTGPSEFKKNQLTYSRVREAYRQKTPFLQEKLGVKSLEESTFSLFLMAFKEEKILEVWISDQGNSKTYRKFISYPFCTTSGVPGPKRKEGDLQIPEGVYHIDRFNPYSNFHLSLGINYPNQSDKILGDKSRPGGDIFIHGDCVTIGCIPITDDKIKELYVMAVEAKDHGQEKIPVHIFPSRPDQDLYEEMINRQQDIPVKELWTSLKKIHENFRETKKIPNVMIDGKGKYYLKGQE